MTTVEQNRQERTRSLPRVSLVQGLFLLILSIAAVLRLGFADALPLSTEEARHALAAWQTWRVEEMDLSSTPLSPAYFTFSTLFFTFLGGSDAVARLAPALFGLALVALPWLWRAQLGTAGALAVSTLLAVSPTMSMSSVFAGGESMALVATLLLFIAWMRFRHNAGEHWLLVAAAALGFGLTTAPLFYSAFFTLAVAWGLQRLLTVSDGESQSGDGVGISQLHRRSSLAVLILTFLLIATCFLWRPTGLGHAAGQFGLWLRQFDLMAGIQALVLPLLALGRYELIVVTMGAAAIFWAAWRGHSLPLLLVYWFAAALLMTILQQGIIFNTLLLVLPSYLLIGLWLQHAARLPAGDVRWALVLALLLLGVIAYFNGARYLRIMTNAPQQLGFLFLAFVALASIVAAINFVRSWDHGAAYQGALVGILLLFIVYNWGSARWMLTEGANDPREYWVQTSTDNDLRMLADLARELSWQSNGSGDSVDLLVALDTPALRWYLRDFSNAVYGETVPPGVDHAVIITPVGEETIAPGEDYLGADLGFSHTGVTMEARPTLGDTMRWWLFHEHPATITGDQLILWVRNDVLE